jgi:uncharacterized RDD family membrane protein YckC
VDNNPGTNTSEAAYEELVSGGHRGKRLGLPQEGRGSLAPVGRRLGALLIDWLLCYIIALAFIGGGEVGPATSFGTLAVFAAENLIMLSLNGQTFGKRVMKLRVISLRTGRPSPGAVVVRTFLLCLVFPAGVYDSDGRGLHDKAAHTAVVNA